MFCLIAFNFLVVLHLREMPLLRSPNHNILSPVLSPQGLHHPLGVELGANHFGLEGRRGLEQLILPNGLTPVQVSIEFSSILNIRSQDCSIRVGLPNLVLAIQIVLLWILIAIVIVFDRCCEDNSLFLASIENTFFEY